MVNKQRVLLVDDVSDHRSELKYNLSKHQDIEVVAEADTTAKAWEILKQDNAVDGVFLDIEFGTEGNSAGLEFASQLNQLAQPPWFMFVTNYPQYALEAYRLHPVDYLVKATLDKHLDAALSYVRQNYPPGKRPMVIKHRTIDKDGDREFSYAFVKRDEIKYITTNNDGTLKIKLANCDIIDGIRGKLKQWLNYGFFRISKSSFVNLDHVKGLEPRPAEDSAFRVTFQCCSDKLLVGPNYLEDLFKRLGGK
ncbi:MAG: LytTR family DNA-binding domain-containing protein [Methylococcales bacterium]